MRRPEDMGSKSPPPSHHHQPRNFFGQCWLGYSCASYRRKLKRPVSVLTFTGPGLWCTLHLSSMAMGKTVQVGCRSRCGTCSCPGSIPRSIANRLGGSLLSKPGFKRRFQSATGDQPALKRWKVPIEGRLLHGQYKLEAELVTWGIKGAGSGASLAYPRKGLSAAALD